MAGMRTSPESLPDHLSGLRLSPESHSENSEEKTIYENLMEIFPLMEDFMKNQGRPSFVHQAPVSFTRAPSRQVPQKRKLEQKAVWTNGIHETNGTNGVDLNEAKTKALNNIPLAQDLQRNVEELSNRLQETQLQSNAATKELQMTLQSKETQLVEMELMVRRLQKEVQRKEQVTQNAEMELADNKDEIARLKSIMRRAETNITETNTKSAGMEQELQDLQLQLLEIYAKMEHNDQILSESLQNVFRGPVTNVEPAGQSRVDRMEWHRRNSEKMEMARRAYMAAVIVARETNQESPLTLCAIMRFQLQAFLRQTDFFVDSQVAGLAFPPKHLESSAS